MTGLNLFEKSQQVKHANTFMLTSTQINANVSFSNAQCFFKKINTIAVNHNYSLQRNYN